MERTNYSSGAPLEEKVGYSRMVKNGDTVYVGGTTSVQQDGTVFGENDPYLQSKYVLEKQVKLVEQAGGVVGDIFSVKVYATNMKRDGAGILKAYSEIFKEIKPLCTVVGTPELNRPTQLVEIEMVACIHSAL